MSFTLALPFGLCEQLLWRRFWHWLLSDLQYLAVAVRARIHKIGFVAQQQAPVLHENKICFVWLLLLSVQKLTMNELM